MLDPQASRFGQAALLSGLMDVPGLLACWEAIPPAKRDAPEHIDRRLARQAVQSRALTLWQAQQLLAGRTSGFQVDRYMLLELIGQGGMGRVYLAMDTRLNRKVALKILAPERINNPRAVTRFQREARVGAQLQHENLVRIYDFGESGGRFFLVMEYIEGRTIGHLLSEQGPMPPATAARLVRQVAMGLAHAHRKGLIHRDVNPYNIMVTHDGVAKLADLGLAIDLTEAERVTRDGATVGTFDYVAPEQARHSHSADIRSDIYSLGCTLYHMLTGQVPFPSPSLPEKLLAHQAIEPEPVEKLAPGVPLELAEVVRTMMRKVPDERYSTPAQVVEALEPFVEDGTAADRAESERAASGSKAAPEPVQLPGSTAGSGTTTAPSILIPIPPGEQRSEVLARAAAARASAALTRVEPAGPLAATDGASASSPATSGGHAGTIAIADAGSAAGGSGSDDAALPLLTPMDEPDSGGWTGTGLPIRLDLEPEAPLWSSAARSSRARAPIDVRAASTAEPAERTIGAALVPGFGLRLSSPWVRGSITAIAVLVTTAAVLVAASRLGRLGSRPATTSATQTPSAGQGGGAAAGSRAADHRPDIKEEPEILVRSSQKESPDDDDVPAPTLIDAVKAAMGRQRGKEGYVELRNREPMTLDVGDLIDVASARGTLDLRARPGTQPVLEVQIGSSRPFLKSGSAVRLSLTGLTIRVHYPPGQDGTSPVRAPVIHAAGAVKIERCSFEVAGSVRPDGCRAILMEGGNLTVDRCWFQGFDRAIRVQSYSTTVTRIGQTMIVPGPGASASADAGSTPELRGWAIGVDLAPTPAPGPRNRRLVLDHCTIEGAGLLEITGRPGQIPLTAEVGHCAVRVESLLAWKPAQPADPLAADLTWRGVGNQLHVLGRTWVVQSAATMSPALTHAVTDLASWSKFVAGETEAIPTPILYITPARERPDPPRPRDLASDPPPPPARPAGADPALVGAAGK